MSDLSDLPLFSGIPVSEPARSKRSAKKTKPAHEAGLPSSQRQALSNIVSFPLCVNVQIVEELADVFLRLRAKHGRRCLDLLLKQHFQPLADRLARIGVSAPDISQQLEDLEAAIADTIEEREGQASTGGHAA